MRTLFTKRFNKYKNRYLFKKKNKSQKFGKSFKLKRNPIELKLNLNLNISSIFKNFVKNKVNLKKTRNIVKNSYVSLPSVCDKIYKAPLRMLAKH